MEKATRELFRAIRGKRSQKALSRWLGYRGNPVADWEAGRRTPTAAEMLRVCKHVGLDPLAALTSFHPSAAPHGLDRAALAHWLNSLRGSTRIGALSEMLGVSRFVVSRWLAGRTEPRVHEFLALLDAITGRASELVALLVPIEKVPSLRSAYLANEAARQLAIRQPWTEAVLRILETREFFPGVVASQLGIDLETEQRCIADLVRAGIVVADASGGLRVHSHLNVDTRSSSGLKAHWARVAADRAQTPNQEDIFSYNVLSASEEDIVLIRQRLRDVFRELRAIVGKSPKSEAVALVNIQFVTFPPSSEAT